MHVKPKDSINRSISKQLLIVGLTISLVVVSPAFARRKSVTSEIEGAVADLVHSHESVTLPAKGTVPPPRIVDGSHSTLRDRTFRRCCSLMTAMASEGAPQELGSDVGFVAEGDIEHANVSRPEWARCCR